MRLIDFQACVCGDFESKFLIEELKTVNHACFPIYESLRLWLKEHKVQAPFRKIVVELRDSTTSSDWHGRASNILGICEVNEAVDPEALKLCGQDTEWIAARVIKGLEHIKAEIGWSDDGLREHAETVACAHPPCSHIFKKLRKRFSGTICDVWLVADVGHTIIKASFTLPNGESMEVVLAEANRPIFLEDDYWIKSAEVLNGHYVLRDPCKRELVRIPIPIS